MSAALRWWPATPLLWMVGAAIWFALVGVDLVADVQPTRAGAPPAAGLWLGADHLGRSVGLRLAVASGLAAVPALVAAAAGLALGVPLGAAAGWSHRVSGQLSDLLIDGLGAIPPMVLTLLLLIIGGDDPWTIGLGVGIGGAPTLAAAIRARMRALRAVQFVEASLLHGVAAWRVLLQHLLWSACRHRVARGAVELATAAVLVEAALSYVGGFGVQEPLPSFGNMIAGGYGQPNGQPLAWLAPLGLLLAISAAGATLAQGPTPSEVGRG